MGAFGKIGNLFENIVNPAKFAETLIESPQRVADAFTGKTAQEKANQTNIDLQKENRQWEESMSNSAYQRAVADMRSAGINPILAAQNGGASTPNVQPAQVESTGKQNAALASSALSIASGIPSMMQNIATARAQENLNSANAVRASMDAKQVSLQNQVLEAKLPSAKAEAALEQYKAEERNKSRSWDLMIDDIKRGVNALNPFSGAGSRRGQGSESVNF